jgi:SAM-dependent methyltransferase
MVKATARSPTGRYDANYGNFQTELYAQIRREAFGEDIGQNSWLTSDEHNNFLEWLDLASGKVLLDVGCGAGGPALRIAAITGCSVVGVDVHEHAVATAVSLAAQRGFAERTKFHVANAGGPLPFSDASFDAITCIDTINYLPDRQRIIAEWTRLLKQRGRLLFTDPVTVKRCARSPQFSPHSPNAALLTQFDSTTSFSHSCQLVFFVCSPRREVLRIKGFAKSDLLPAEFSRVK